MAIGFGRGECSAKHTFRPAWFSSRTGFVTNFSQFREDIRTHPYPTVQKKKDLANHRTAICLSDSATTVSFPDWNVLLSCNLLLPNDINFPKYLPILGQRKCGRKSEILLVGWQYWLINYGIKIAEIGDERLIIKNFLRECFSAFHKKLISSDDAIPRGDDSSWWCCIKRCSVSLSIKLCYLNYVSLPKSQNALLGGSAAHKFI